MPRLFSAGRSRVYTVNSDSRLVHCVFHILPKFHLFRKIVFCDLFVLAHEVVIQVVKDIMVASFVEMGIFEIQPWYGITVS